jgi:hypothetical protein
VEEVVHGNMQIMKKHPFALKIITYNQTQVLYFETREKLEKWQSTLRLIIEENFNKSHSRSFRSKHYSKALDSLNQTLQGLKEGPLQQQLMSSANYQPHG